MPGTQLRVASFVPVATEWMYALRLQRQLVGVTFACDVPAVAKREKPVLIRSPHAEDFEHLDAGEIHTRMSALEADGHVHPVFELDEAALAQARPDVILSQTLCSVCAAADPHLDAAARVLGENVLTVGLNATRLDEAWEDGLAVAEAVGHPAVGEHLVARLTRRVDAVRAAVADRPRPRVAYLEWPAPPMRAGHWLPDVVDAAGGDEVLGRAGERSIIVSWDAVRAAEPDVVLVAPCGLDVARALAAAREVAREVPSARVIALDANRYLSSSGPGLATSVELVAHILHPDAVPEDPDPTAWVVASAGGEAATTHRQASG